MKELFKKIMKSILRIAVFSIGGLLTIFGIMFCLYFLVHLPDSLSKDLPYFIFAIVILSVGLSLCFLVIKPMRYFIKSRKMSKEEKVIHNIKIYMKQGNSRIAGMIFFLIFMISISILIMSLGNKLNRTMTPENIRLLSLVKATIALHLFALFTGLIIGMLILEIAGVTKDKHRLTLNMWERIQELEDEVKELKVSKNLDEQQISEVEGGDNASGAG